MIKLTLTLSFCLFPYLATSEITLLYHMAWWCLVKPISDPDMSSKCFKSKFPLTVSMKTFLVGSKQLPLILFKSAFFLLNKNALLNFPFYWFFPGILWSIFKICLGSLFFSNDRLLKIPVPSFQRQIKNRKNKNWFFLSLMVHQSLSLAVKKKSHLDFWSDAQKSENHFYWWSAMETDVLGTTIWHVGGEWTWFPRVDNIGFPLKDQ